MSELDEKGVKFRSITKSSLDTSKKSSQSEFIIDIFASLAQLERGIIIERTKAGLKSGKASWKSFRSP